MKEEVVYAENDANLFVAHKELHAQTTPNYDGKGKQVQRKAFKKHEESKSNGEHI